MCTVAYLYPRSVQGTGDGHSSIAAYGSLEDVAAALEGLTYGGQTDRFSGVDNIFISLVDAGGLSVSHIIKVEVEANSPPTIIRVNRLASLPKTPHMDEDTVLLLDAVEVSVADSSPNSTVQVEVFAVTGVVNLLVSNDSNELSTASRGTGVDLVVTGDIDHVNRALRSLSYTPKADLWGADELSIVARQGRSGERRGWHEVAAIETIIVMIGPVNDPPRIDVPAALTSDKLPMVSAGDMLPLPGIIVHDPDAWEPAGSELISVDIRTVDSGNLVGLALSSATIQGRIPGVRFDQGSAEGTHPHIAFSGRIEIANGALGLLHFVVPFGQPSGQSNITISVSDLGNWGYGNAEMVSTVITVDVQYRQNPYAVDKGPVEWDIPPGALTMEEDGRLDDLGIQLIPNGANKSATTLVEATVTADHGMMQLAESGGQLVSKHDMKVIQNGPGSMSISGGLNDVSGAMSRWYYVPQADYHGMEVLELSIQALTEKWMVNASVPILIRSRPDLPVITVANSPLSIISDTRTVEVGSRLKLYGIVVKHVDATQDDPMCTITMTALSSAGNGTMVMDSTQPGLWIYNEEGTTGSLVARGAVENLQLALDSGALEYVPIEGYDGIDIITVSILYDGDYRPSDDGNTSRIHELFHSQKVEAVFEVNVIPALIPAVVIFNDESLFRADEGSAIELTGIGVQAPGRWNTSEVVVIVRFETDGGGVTLPAAEGREVVLEQQGPSILVMTGTELEVNMALSGAVFKAGSFYNGVVAVKVRALSVSGDRIVLRNCCPAAKNKRSIICFHVVLC